mgnify:FL=1
MKKKLIEILNVSKVLKDLTTKRFNNFSVSYKIAKAAKLVDEQNAFYVEEERKIVEHYAVKDEETGQVKIIDGNRISFANQDDAMNFNKEINELQQTEVEIFDPIDIHISDFRSGDMDLTPSDILALEGFVNFID